MVRKCGRTCEFTFEMRLMRTAFMINYGKFSLTYRGATVWNGLTTDLKELKSYNKFKTSLKVHIQNDLHLVG